MNTFPFAIAVAIAAPAAAQYVPAVQHDHAQHTSPGGHAGHQGHGQHQGEPHAQYHGESTAAGCCADKDGNGKMDCCEAMHAAPPKAAEPGAPKAPAEVHGH